MSSADKELLWCLCFGDEADVPKSLFDIPDVTTLTEWKNDTLVGMATLVPVSTSDGLSGYYAYGVCVHPEYRERGIFKKIMERCEEYARLKNADILCLIPATNELAQTYMRMGYSQRIALADKKGHGASISSDSLEFFEFAKPDSIDAHILTEDFGLLKYLSERSAESFYFSSAMGER